MPTIRTDDKTEIYYKDWGSGQPVVFSHGWPLDADAWEDQMFFLASKGYRCIAHDRRETVDPANLGPATIWTPTPTILLRSLRLLTCTMRSMSGIRPEEVRLLATLDDMERNALQRQSSLAQFPRSC